MSSTEQALDGSWRQDGIRIEQQDVAVGTRQHGPIDAADEAEVEGVLEENNILALTVARKQAFHSRIGSGVINDDDTQGNLALLRDKRIKASACLFEAIVDRHNDI